MRKAWHPGLLLRTRLRLVVLVLFTSLPLWAGEVTSPVLSVPVKPLPFLGNPGSAPAQLVRLGSMVLLVADDGWHGSELWRSDGTPDGTRMVRDIRPGPSSSSPGSLTVMGDAVYFSANTVESGTELWRSDGTAAGTRLVLDIEPGSASSNVTSLASAGGWLFFSASTSAEGANLWKTDGTAEGTQLVLDFVPGPASGYPYATNIAPLGNGVIFTAPVTGSRSELWGSDGTAAGTRRLWSSATHSPAVPYPAKYYPSIPGVAFFNASYAGSGALWRTDGTPEGTWQLGNAPTATFPYGLGSKLLFAANDGVYGEEPWVTDGTVAGTGILKDLDTTSPTATHWSHPQGFFPIGDQVGFLADTLVDQVWELWKTDATADGTQRVTNVDRTLRSVGGDSGVSLGAKSVFFGAAGTSGHGLWVTDGTAAGTSLLKSLGTDSPSNSPIVALGTKAVFAAGDGQRGSELWVTDGTEGGTQLLLDICGHRWNYSPVESTWFKNQLYFRAPTASSGNELWRSNGTAAGTAMFYDLVAGTFGGEPGTFLAGGNLLYFYAKGATPTSGDALWRTDGTTGGTLRLHSSAPSRPNSTLPWTGPPQAVLNGSGYFPAAGATGYDVWKTNGTASGTSLFKDIPGTSTTNSPDNFHVAAGKLFFTGYTATALNISLYSSDGTAAGTQPVLLPGGISITNRPRRLRSDGTRLYFTSNGLNNADAVFCTDDIGTGSVKLADGYGWEPTVVQPASGGPVLYLLIRQNSTGQTGLWRSEGTPGTTRMVKSLPDPGGSFVAATSAIGLRGLTSAGGRLFFVMLTPETGEELWTSDGTEAGTVMVKDIAPGPESSSPSSLMAHGGYVLFSAWDAVHGRELWISDGTAAGTVLVEDFSAGISSAMPVSLTPAGTALSFFLSGPEMPQHELRSLPGYTLTTVTAPAAGGSVSGSGVHPAGAAVAVTASAAAGFVFNNWAGLPAGSASEAATRIRLTGDLTLTAHFSAVSDFDEWIAGFPLQPEQRFPDLNPSGDGVANLLKYALNLNPAFPDTRSFDPAVAAGLPVLRQTPAGLRFEYPERRGALLTYEPEAAADLTGWHLLAGSVERTQLNTFWDMVSITPDASALPGFFRIRITLGPVGP